MSVHNLKTKPQVDAIQQAKIHLAAANRLAVLDDLHEGIDNHFTMTVPGAKDRYLILPFGLHWSEARASDMLVFNENGETLEGEGVVELSAQCIHAPVHRITGANVVLHTHQTPKQTPSKSFFSAFFRCPHNCIFEHSPGHNGPVRDRNTNFSELTSETMWSQPILIKLLLVLFLLQTHNELFIMKR